MAAAGALALAGIAASTPARADEKQDYSLTFSTRNQSMFGPDQGTDFKWDQDLGFGWDFNSGTIGGFFNPGIHLPWPIGDISLGETGAAIGFSSTGRAGVYMNIQASSGTVNADYPVHVKIEYPTNGTLYPGDPYTIKTSWDRTSGATMWTTGPRARLEMGAYINAKNSIPFRAAVAGHELINRDLLDLIGGGVFHDVMVSEDFFPPIDTSTYEGSSTFPGEPGTTGNLTVTNHKLVLDSQGALAAGTGSNQLMSSVRQNFLSLDGSISNHWFPSKTEISFDYGLANLDLRTELMNLYCKDFHFDGQQNFALTPTPTIDVPLPGGEVVKIKVGDSITRVFPGVAPGTARNDVAVSPTVRLRNNFNSRTDLVVSPQLYLKPCYFYAKGGLHFEDIFSFNFGPWKFDPIDEINLTRFVAKNLGLSDADNPEISFKLLEKSYELGGFGSQTTPFTIKGYTYPVPVLNAVAPIMIQQHSPATTFTFTGSDFVAAHGINPSSKVHWDGPSGPADAASERVTTIASSTQVTGVLTKNDLEVEAIHYVTVFNPAPGGGASAKLPVMVDGTPPAHTAGANPPKINPPTGKMVPVNISGTITDNMVGVDPNTASFKVLDEYGLVQPSGPITLGAGGSYSFTIMLEARRLGTDTDGRDYTVTISAADKVKNASSYSFKINVEHSQGNGQGPKP